MRSNVCRATRRIVIADVGEPDSSDDEVRGVEARIEMRHEQSAADQQSRPCHQHQSQRDFPGHEHASNAITTTTGSAASFLEGFAQPGGSRAQRGSEAEQEAGEQGHSARKRERRCVHAATGPAAEPWRVRSRRSTKRPKMPARRPQLRWRFPAQRFPPEVASRCVAARLPAPPARPFPSAACARGPVADLRCLRTQSAARMRRRRASSAAPTAHRPAGPW